MEFSLDHLMGLLPTLKCTPPFDISFVDTLEVPVYLTIRSADLSRTSWGELKEWGQLELSHTHCGKGLTHDVAIASCIMEAAERFSAAYYPLDGRTVVAPYKEVAEEAVDPRCLYIPRGVEFNEDRPITWFVAQNLADGKEVMVPVDHVLMDIPDSAFPFEGFESKRLGFFFSNGLAAGACLEDATHRALLEVVERDAQWRLAKGLAPPIVEVDLSSQPELMTLVERFQRSKLTLRVFCLQTIDGIYSMVATSWDPYCKMLVMGSSANNDPKEAVNGAVLEVAQQRAFTFFKEWKVRREYFPILRYIKERIDPSSYMEDVPQGHWSRRAMGPAPFGDLVAGEKACVRPLTELLAQQREVVVLDLTHPDVGIPVVRTIVGGLKNGFLYWKPAVSFLRQGERT